ncbi:tetratricopeptide repeat protein [Paenibacillus sp. YYML68]|uniref:tetratricopeptide repeat protein n=1 Tax=Paenibacillus sp. YYML68 TaxID=2909250 RepID=UPI0024938225|nr:tetratricopeptide repeat protein [Paenibacillus sp. YYML68]
MSKLLLFPLLWWLFGNPFVALLVLLLILYMMERRFIGLTPSLLKPLTRMRKLSKLKEELRLSPHHTSTKLEIARLYMEEGKYDAAYPLLTEVLQVMDDSADVLSELGTCELKRGAKAEGEAHILQALELNPRVKYGEPYLRLAESFALSDPQKAVQYLEQFRTIHSSSCEANYRLGALLKQLGRVEEARQAFRETVELYRGLPRYKRRHERRWALLARLQA